jgi:hypothetical protein
MNERQADDSDELQPRILIVDDDEDLLDTMKRRQVASTCRRLLSAGVRASESAGRRHAKKRHVCATRENQRRHVNEAHGLAPTLDFWGLPSPEPPCGW